MSTSNIDEIVLKLTSPAKIAVGNNLWGGSDALIDGQPGRGSFAPWGSCPDVLYHSQSRTLCGLAYGVHEKWAAEVRDLSKTLDPRVVRYTEFRLPATIPLQSQAPAPRVKRSPKAVPWVAQEFEGQDFLQITWTDIEPDTFGLAQLANDAWFYSPTGEVL